MRVLICFVSLLLVLVAGCSKSQAPAPADLVVHKSPTCSCCGKWVDHVNGHGLSSQVVIERDIGSLQERLGIPERSRSCHVAVAGEYLIVGHVPAEDIKRLLAQKPQAKGLSVPGMPVGSPGMEMGGRQDPYDVFLIQEDGTRTVFAHHGNR